MILAGVAYIVIGLGFTILGGSTHRGTIILWRWLSWVASLGVAAAQIWYEVYRKDSSPKTTALRAAGAVAIGAFGLALAANIHWMHADRETRPAHSPLLALPIWPIMTAIPAFIAAFGAAWVLSRVRRQP